MGLKRGRRDTNNGTDTDGSSEGEIVAFSEQKRQRLDLCSETTHNERLNSDKNGHSMPGKITVDKSSSNGKFDNGKINKHHFRDDLEESLFGMKRSGKDNGKKKEKEEEKESGSVSELFESGNERESREKPSSIGISSDDSASSTLDDLFAPDATIPISKSKGLSSKEDFINQIKDKKEKTHSDLAKKKLSKWAARLFDPNRPRGLVEPPQVIPLNDEFLQDFGKREKHYFDSVGEPLDIDREQITDVEIEERDDTTMVTDDEKVKESCKVKITNLAFTTSLAKLSSKVQEFGATINVNLVMDENGRIRNNLPLSIGRAYVTFNSHDSAAACIEKLNEKPFDGRILRVSLAQEIKPKRKTSTANNIMKNNQNRYWEKNISMKCYHCGQVGHSKDNCVNAEKKRPCPLCAVVGHDLWHCPIGMHCFNCGVPGHVLRDCPYGRGLPPRVVCGMCCTSGHHRWQCQISDVNIQARDAICFICGKLGHISCKDMKWSYGLKEIFCFNCGMRGHHGLDCNRPNFDICSRKAEVANKEIEMAMYWNDTALLATRELDTAFRGSSSKQFSQRGMPSKRDHDAHRSRAKSEPPQRGYRSNASHSSMSNNGYSQHAQNNKRSPPPPPSRRGYENVKHNYRRSPPHVYK